MDFADIPHFLFGLFFLSVLLNGGAFLATVVILSLMLIRGMERLKSLSFASFFLGGAAVAHLQWMIFSERDPTEVGWYILATIALVFETSLLGIFCGWRYKNEEKLIPVIIIMTIVLAIFQFSGIRYEALNWYARVYAIVCLAAPLVLILRRQNRNQVHGVFSSGDKSD